MSRILGTRSRALTRGRGTRRKIGYWRLGNGLLTSRMRAYVPMCEGNFERRSASAGVLGETAPAVAGRRRAMGWGF